MIIAVFKFAGIHLTINLSESFLAGYIHIFQGSGIFGLKDCHTAIERIADDYVTASFPVFFVGFHKISGTGKDPGQKSMVKIFAIIMVADRFSQQMIHLSGYGIAVSLPYGIK